MSQQITSEIRDVLKDWDEGHRISSIRIGHDRRIRQDVAHQYAFDLIRAGLAFLPDHDRDTDPETVLAYLEELRAHVDPGDTTEKEREAGTSLAYSVLRFGWEGTLVNFANFEEVHIRVCKAPEVPA